METRRFAAWEAQRKQEFLSDDLFIYSPVPATTGTLLQGDEGSTD